MSYEITTSNGTHYTIGDYEIYLDGIQGELAVKAISENDQTVTVNKDFTFRFISGFVFKIDNNGIMTTLSTTSSIYDSEKDETVIQCTITDPADAGFDSLQTSSSVLKYTISSEDAMQTASNLISSVPIVGTNVVNYAPSIAQSIVWTAENFADNTEPASPYTGQHWYNSDTDVMYVYNGMSFTSSVKLDTDGELIFGDGSTQKGSALTANIIRPNPASMGQFWYDPANQTMSYYTGSDFVTNIKMFEDNTITFGDGSIQSAAAVISSPTEPAGNYLTTGQLWYNTIDQVTYRYTGTDFTSNIKLAQDDTIQFGDGTEQTTAPSYPATCSIRDTRGKGVNGGALQSGTGGSGPVWVKRELSQITGQLRYGSASVQYVTFNDGTDSFLLIPGTYIVDIDCPAYKVDSHKARLYNVTTDTTEMYGTSAFSPVQGDAGSMADSAMTSSVIKGVITLTEDTLFEIHHYCSAPNENDDALGVAVNVDGSEEVYTDIMITKIQ